jgi:TonB family protein
MGLWEFLQQWPRGRLITGVVTSIAIHLLVVGAALWGLVPELEPKWKAKPGDTLIVELPSPEEPGAAGSPAAPPPPKSPARVEARPAPPPRREAPPPREERRVVTAPRTVEPPPPAPRAPEPPPKAAEPPPSLPEPAPRAAEPAPPAPEPAPRVAEPAPSAPTPSEPQREGGERQIASLPPAGPPTPSVSDVRAALRRGAGGQGQGRGGIEGDPIPLDSADAQYNDYLEQVRRKIKEKWGFPCVRNAQTRACDHHTTSLDVQFGILKDGRVQFVDVVRSATYDIYDEYAVNAIKLASPFPPVPPAMMRAMRAGSAGVPISARFSYVVESSLTNLLR